MRRTIILCVIIALAFMIGGCGKKANKEDIEEKVSKITYSQIIEIDDKGDSSIIEYDSEGNIVDSSSTITRHAFADDPELKLNSYLKQTYYGDTSSSIRIEIISKDEVPDKALNAIQKDRQNNNTVKENQDEANKKK